MAAPAYQYQQAAPVRSDRPRVRVTPGGRTSAQAEGKPSSLVFAGVVAAALLVVIAVACFARLAFTAATVQTSLAAQQVEESLEEARYVGTTLEVQQTSLSGSTRIKAAASALDMVEPDEVVAIVLPEDVVVADSDGVISLAGSLSVATAAK